MPPLGCGAPLLSNSLPYVRILVGIPTAYHIVYAGSDVIKGFSIRLVRHSITIGVGEIYPFLRYISAY